LDPYSGSAAIAVRLILIFCGKGCVVVVNVISYKCEQTVFTVLNVW